MNFEEETATFFDINDGSVVANITLDDNSVIEVIGDFGNEYYAFEGIDGTVINSSKPKFICPSQNVSNVKKQNIIQIGSVSYKIAEIEPDGTGITTLILNR